MTDNDTKRLDPEQAERKINGIARFGSIIPTGHLTDRMYERSYDFQDLEKVLSLGKVRKPPEYDEKHNQWKYQVEGEVIDGEKATVVVTILSRNEIQGITIMDK
jgi:hypothetical protein